MDKIAIRIQSLTRNLPTSLPMSSIREFLARFDYDQILLIILGVLLMVDIGLLLAATSRFERSRLILSYIWKT